MLEQVAGMNNVNDVVTKDLKVKDSKAPVADSIMTIKAKAKITALSLDNKISAANNLHVETTNQKIHVEGTVGNKNDIEVIKKSLLNIKDAKAVETNIEVK